MAVRLQTDPESVKFLNAAIAAGDIDEVASLVEQGISVRHPGQFRMLPMLVAARDQKNAAIVSLLIDHGVDVDAPLDPSGRRALYYAADEGHFDNVRALLDRGAAVDALDNHGQSALWAGAFSLVNVGLNVADKALWRSDHTRMPRDHAAVVQALILAGADVNRQSGADGLGSLSPARLVRDAGILRLIDLLQGRETPPKRSFLAGLFGRG